MKFKRILKRKVYPTWVSTTKAKKCKVYILYIPSIDCYHYQIICDNGNTYNSLDDNNKFDNFKECCLAAEKFIAHTTF